MRRALLCLLTIAALAAPAGASLGAPARGSKSARAIPSAPASQPLEAPNPILPIPIPLAASRQGRDPDQCRTSCARTYYFCRSNGDDDSCSGQWAQCKARCTATYSRPGS
jgi:hypothetical protein